MVLAQERVVLQQVLVQQVAEQLQSARCRQVAVGSVLREQAFLLRSPCRPVMAMASCLPEREDWATTGTVLSQTGKAGGSYYVLHVFSWVRARSANGIKPRIPPLILAKNRPEGNSQNGSGRFYRVRIDQREECAFQMGLPCLRQQRAGLSNKQNPPSVEDSDTIT